MMKIEQTRAKLDPGGIVRRGEAVQFHGYVERYGEAPRCFVGAYGERGPTLAPPPCQSPAVMEVYGVALCEIHGEEAAAGALLEIAHDLEQELQRPMNDHVRALSPHLEAALRRGAGILGEEGESAEERSEALLLAAYPLDRGRVEAGSVFYAEDPDANNHRRREPPFDAFMSDRMLIHRHMRLAFEDAADWLVEMLEEEREVVASQAAYALALEQEAGLR